MNGMLCGTQYVINTEVSGGRFNKKVVAVNMDGGGAAAIIDRSIGGLFSV